MKWCISHPRIQLIWKHWQPGIPTIYFHRIGPLGRFGLVFEMSVCVYVPFPCDSPRGVKEVQREQSQIPQWHQYPEKMYIITNGSPPPHPATPPLNVYFFLLFFLYPEYIFQWYRCFYPQWLRDLVSPVCEIFFMSPYCFAKLLIYRSL